MTTSPPYVRALSAADPSVRLRAALAAGTDADPGHVDILITRCGLESDFFVRDMLTWALTRLPVDATLPALIGQFHAPHAQARSQSLHTVSKIADSRAWDAIDSALLHDEDDEVARAAWRAAVAVVPARQRALLATDLSRELGRRDVTSRRGLSRALVALGDVIEPVLTTAHAHPDPAVRAHATATTRLAADPDADFEETSC